jgi:hypothetical protein
MNGVLVNELDPQDVDTIASYLEEQFVKQKGAIGFGKLLTHGNS